AVGEGADGVTQQRTMCESGDPSLNHRRSRAKNRQTGPVITPLSCLNFIAGSGNSDVLETPNADSQGDRAKVLEAAKLLNIQKQVGLSFDVVEGETIKQLIEQEECDRAKKMDWEQRTVQ
ncbi:hypothetical protein A2U01_0037490, partial [Trifolium medium]|nr:hypothetical protein [Trifolium medium]